MENKYPTIEESEKIVKYLEKVGFDLERWEQLEQKAKMVELGIERRMGEEGFELMDYRQMIHDANQL